MRIPQRRSLITETYDVLLEAINRGTWEKLLPGERQLCARFRISRLTLRQALKHLESEGVIQVEHGKRRMIARKRRDKGTTERLVVGYLCDTSEAELPGYISRALAQLETLLHGYNLEFQLFARPSCYTHSPDRQLQNLVQEASVGCWMVQRANREMQAWFHQNHIPVMLAGSAYTDIPLPFVDLDNAAVCRHAVGRLIAHGCRSICFLALNIPAAGDEQSVNGFKEGIAANANVSGKIVRTESSPAAVYQKLESILSSRQPPDGLLIDQSNHAYTAVGLLLKKGYRIPQDISVICRTESIDFPYLVPSVAHYSRNIPEVAKKAAELARKLIRGESIESRSIRFFPDFVPGQSL